MNTNTMQSKLLDCIQKKHTNMDPLLYGAGALTKRNAGPLHHILDLVRLFCPGSQVSSTKVASPTLPCRARDQAWLDLGKAVQLTSRCHPQPR